MKFNFKKIAPFVATAIMLGATVAAANYPAPFSTSGASIVVGGSAPASDLMAATKIVNDLVGYATPGTTATTTVAGDSAQITGADELYIDGVFTQTMDDTDLQMLADGTFTENEGDNDNDVDYNQFLTVGALTATYQQNTEDDKSKAGMYVGIADGTVVYTYKLEFNQAVKIDDGDTGDGAKIDMLASELEMLGQSYTITDVTLDAGDLVNEITMLTGADEKTQSEYSTQTYTVDGKSYTVKVVAVTTTEAKFEINGVASDGLEVGQTDTVSGLQIGVTEILENEGTETGGEDQVSFYLGANEVVLDNGGEITIDDEDVDGSAVTIASTNTGDITSMTSIQVAVARDGDDVFLAAGDTWSDPVFDADIKFAGLTEDASVNEVSIDTSATSGKITFTNSDGDEIELPLDTDLTNVFLGDDSVAADLESFLNVDETMTTVTEGTAGTATDDHYFIVSTDNAGSKAHLFKIDKIVTTAALTTDDVVTVVDITADIEEEVAIKIDLADTGDTTLFGDWNVQLTTTTSNVLSVGEGAGNGEVLSTAGVTNAITTAKMIKLQNGATMGILGGADPTIFISEDGVRDYAGGKGISAKVTYDTEVKVAFADVDINGAAALIADDEDSSNFQDYTDWGAKLEWNDDSFNLDITSPEDQTIVDAYVLATGATVSTTAAGTATGVGYVVEDNLMSTTDKAKDLIVVGGSCINTVAAKLLGSDVPKCGAEWTALTNVSANQALVKVFNNPYSSGKIAMLVAGYEAADTTKAASYVIANKPSTAVDTSMRLSTASEVATVVA